MTPLPPLPIVTPLLGAAFLAGIRKWSSRPVADSISIAVAALNVVFCSLLLHSAWIAPVLYWMGNWYPRGSMVLGIGLYIDPTAAGIALLASTLTLLALIFSWKYVDSGNDHMHPLLLVFLAAMCGFSLTGDIFNLFVFFELMSVAAFALCGLDQKEPVPLQGAFNFAVTNTLAAFLILTGIAMLYSITGALNLAQIGSTLAGRHDTTVLFACTLLFCGFMVKSAIVPFHFWLADAHAVAPTPVCVLFSGLMVELGLYAVLRLRVVVFSASLAPHEEAVRNLLLAAAVLTVVVGSLMCYAEHHLKRMLAFSTISHAGLMLSAIAFGNPLSAAGFLIYLLGHALVKSALFLTAGMQLHCLRSVSESILFRRGVGKWGMAALWFCGGLGLAGFPLFLLMQGDAFAEAGAKASGVSWLGILFAFGGLFTAAAVFRTGMHTFFGWGTQPLGDDASSIPERPDTTGDDDVPRWYHYGPPLLCLAAAAALTFVPSLPLATARIGAQVANQSYYFAQTYAAPAAALVSPTPPEARPAIVAGLAAAVLAMLLALSSVFHLRFTKLLRIGVYLEHGFVPLRELHSGHAADYVTWLTAGLSLFGSVLYLAFR